MSWGTLQGERIVSGSVVIPSFGAWVADLMLAQPDTLPAQVSLTLGALTMLGTAYRSGADVGARSVRVVGGYGGWGNTVGPQDYDHPGSLLASLVLGDAAQAAGEKVAIAQDFIVGDKFVRTRGPARRVLDRFTDPVAGPIWWTRPDGVTFIGPHPTGGIASQFDITQLARGKGRFTVATETETDWLPGRTFVSPILDVSQTVSSVTYTISPDGPVRLEVLVDPTADRIGQDLRTLIEETDPAHDYRGFWEFAVESSSSGKADLRSTDPSMPDLVGCPVYTGIPGASVTLTPGSLCLVCFANQDPTRPRVVLFDSNFDLTHTAVQLQTGLNTGRKVLCIGDAVIINGAVVPGGSGSVTGVVTSTTDPGSLAREVTA